MRFYTQQHGYYCGIDLHARAMYVCILDCAGNVVFHKNFVSYARLIKCGHESNGQPQEVRRHRARAPTAADLQAATSTVA
jgi:hypothetical protein